jgi:hypothetical protein
MEIEVKRGGCGCGGCVASVFSVALTLGIGLLAFGMVFAMPHGGRDEVMAAMAQCPAVAAAMGTSLRESKMSMGCGEESSGGGSGNATWTISVYGPRQGGSVSYQATYLGNQPWEVQRAVVALDDGRSISAVPCDGGSASPPGAPGRAPPDRGGDRGKGGKRR